MNYFFDSLEDLKKHIDKEGMPGDFIANADSEPSLWAAHESRLMAAIGALRMSPYLVLASENENGQVFEVRGCDSFSDLPTFPEFVAGQDWPEAWGKLLNALDALVPEMPVSTFDAEQLRDMLAGV